ncbi:MAG: NADH-quinone oxidoreductase subunit NuoG [Burkholderiaceae bacterium]|jgi:NADH-quinone oxidoreductase subunit G|nr:NADH-quinone oxidoreductase subunit NuoG [Burkholderiaceae bacterium]
MVELEIDGKKVEVAEGCMVMHAAEKSGTYIPHFCYHKKLSIAASCRMCLVDVEKVPKAVPACATPVTQGMVVRTRSEKTIQAQQAVMEFLLINHPLDCPVCDQGGECQLQDLAVGYGRDASRYSEEKRVVAHKDAGPLISMQEMSRCIQCTRCVRFGQEIAGVMELGCAGRGEHAEIETFVGAGIDSELSGNMIDICPVGALTSKPFRFSARTWELSRRKSISPHDSTGANLIVQVKNHRVMRVVPLENEAVNECWIADRDRFSYEALNGPARLHRPMLKQDGQWITVNWQTALEYVANGLGQIRREHGAAAIGALVSPHSTLEEIHLLGALMRALGSENVDYRLRAQEMCSPEGVRWLGMPVAALSTLEAALVVGSNLRKDHPLFAQRIRQAARRGARVMVITSPENLSGASAWAMPLQEAVLGDASAWAQALANVAVAVARAKGVAEPFAGEVTKPAYAMAQALLAGERKAILLGNGAAHSANASTLLAIGNWIAEQTGARLGYLTEAANTVGAQWARALPGEGGLNARQMLAAPPKGMLLFQCEPAADCAEGAASVTALQATGGMVVSLNTFKANMDVADVLLPIAPFTETSGTFVNAEGRVQSFHAVVRPLAEARPGWKVLRVLAEMLDVAEGLRFESSQEVLHALHPAAAQQECAFVPAQLLSNAMQASARLDGGGKLAAPDVVGIYELDGMVRRAPSLQLTADAKKPDLLPQKATAS